MTGDLFPPDLPDGVRHLGHVLDEGLQRTLLTDVRRVIESAPLFIPAMPRTGKPFSVAMTNCGALGWLSDKAGGYRYEPLHPVSRKPWPPMPAVLLQIWREFSEFPAPPEACLVNFYAPGTKLGSHRDEDEREPRAPVLSVSLGDDAVFHVGGTGRRDAKQRVILKSGDVLVLGGASRMAFHGVDRILAGTSDLLAEGGRINLTLRRVTPA